MLENTKYDVTEVIKHDEWDGSGLTFPDLALIKLARKVKFYEDTMGVDSIVPVCLSNSNVRTGVYNAEAFVAGKLFEMLNELSYYLLMQS